MKRNKMEIKLLVKFIGLSILMLGSVIWFMQKFELLIQKYDIFSPIACIVLTYSTIYTYLTIAKNEKEKCHINSQSQ